MIYLTCTMIAHCQLFIGTSSKNVLLDLDYEDYVSNFSTAKLLNQDSSKWTLFAGTYGYVAPGNVLISLIII